MHVRSLTLQCDRRDAAVEATLLHVRALNSPSGRYDGAQAVTWARSETCIPACQGSHSPCLKRGACQAWGACPWHARVTDRVKARPSATQSHRQASFSPLFRHCLSKILQDHAALIPNWLCRRDGGGAAPPPTQLLVAQHQRARTAQRGPFTCLFGAGAPWAAAAGPGRQALGPPRRPGLHRRCEQRNKVKQQQHR